MQVQCEQSGQRWEWEVYSAPPAPDDRQQQGGQAMLPGCVLDVAVAVQQRAQQPQRMGGQMGPSLHQQLHCVQPALQCTWENLIVGGRTGNATRRGNQGDECNLHAADGVCRAADHPDKMK